MDDDTKDNVITYNTSDWCLKGIEKSNNKLFKYKASITNGFKTVIILFGSCDRSGEPFEQYCDRTGLKLYKDYDNFNTIKAKAWYIKNASFINKLFWSSKLLEYIFLQKI